MNGVDGVVPSCSTPSGNTAVHVQLILDYRIIDR